MELYLAQTYGAETQRAEIKDPRVCTMVAEVGDTMIAYAQVRAGPAPSCVEGPLPVELWRLYVDQPWIGLGIAQRLMAAVRTQAEAFGGQTLWLSVWESNFRALAFYRRCGFVDVGAHPYRVGNDMQTDRLMACPLHALEIG
jgi:ribosomal protein S18 acetylase RimI-like enzyme